jgi:hypothetical protein
MSEDKNNSRRKVLKIAAGAGLVAGSKANWESNKWTKPVVETVLLPAHAQTSEIINGVFAGSTSATSAAFQPFEPSGFDSLIPTAHAQGSIPSDLCITIVNNQVNASAVINGYQLWEGTGALDTVLNLTTGKSKTTCVLDDVTLKVSVKGTEPNRDAYGVLSFGYGCFDDIPLPGYSSSYEIMETDKCGKFKLTKNPIVPCKCGG